MSNDANKIFMDPAAFARHTLMIEAMLRAAPQREYAVLVCLFVAKAFIDEDPNGSSLTEWAQVMEERLFADLKMGPTVGGTQ